MSETTPHQKKRRNARSHKAILDATVKLLGSNGYIDFSIEKVAGEAGVGKQTIYRWWDSRADLVLEVWRDRLLPPLPVYDEKTPLRDCAKPRRTPPVLPCRFIRTCPAIRACLVRRIFKASPLCAVRQAASRLSRLVSMSWKLPLLMPV
jgi:AcrR family transcriptional regulator